MPVSRRSALVALGSGSVAAAVSAASPNHGSGRQRSLERAVEALRVAMLEGNGEALDRLVHGHLAYMHSSGHSQTKSMLLFDLAGKRFFSGLAYAEQSVEAVGRNGLVKLTVDQVKNIGNGQTRLSRIKVLQVWTHEHSGWQLLARSSAIISSPIMRPCGATEHG